MTDIYLGRRLFTGLAAVSAGAAMSTLASRPARAQSATQTPAQCEADLIAKLGADVQRRYIRTPSGYLMVLRMGDNLFEHLTRLAIDEKLPSASLTGIGFGHPTFGFWNAEKRAFDPRTFRNVEMGSLTGSVAWKEGKPSIHIHGVAGDNTFATYGGHLLDLEVGTGSLEITLIVHDKRLERAVDPCIGANVLGL